MATRIEQDYASGTASPAERAARGLAPDFARVLVVGNSQVNRIVVARIVERSGLKPISETPVTAIRVLPLLFPALAVLDGGPQNSDCDAVMAGIVALRRISVRHALPAVILLTNRNVGVEALSEIGTVDAVVTKPFTTEQLQPVIDRLVSQARG